MSRNIKTVKCLAKHVGKTVKVVDEKGHTFLAHVMADKSLCLWTTDKAANDSVYWWGPVNGKWCHYCEEDYQITEELKSLTLVSEKKAVKKPSKKVVKDNAPVFADEETVKKNVGKFCKLYNGKIGKLVDRGNRSPLLLLKENDSEVGWALSSDSEYRKEGWEYGWNMHDQGCETAKIVEFFDKDPTTKEESNKEKTKPILLAKELLKSVGHYCEMYDGSEGFIAKSCYKGNVCVIHNSKGPSEGWPLLGRRDDVVGFPKKLISKFTKGWHVEGDHQATQVKVTKILDKTYESKKPSKCAESTTKKTIYDLTVRELLEKLNEIVIS